MKTKLIILSLFGLVSSGTQAQRYLEISAKIELVSYRSGDTNGAAKAKPRIISVVCITGTNEWRIEHDDMIGGEEKWHFDGTNVFNSIRALQPMSEQDRERLSKAGLFAIVPFEQARSNLTINIWSSGDGHPMGDRGVNIPWLAFCSGAYLKRADRLIPLPVDMLRHTRDRFAYTDQTRTFEDEYALPRVVELFTSKSLLKTSEDNFDNEAFFGDRYAKHKERIVSELEEGVLMFHYKVDQSTNFLGWNVPLEFEFFQNPRLFEQNADWSYRGVGKVESLRETAKPKNIFDPSLRQTIVDWRFRNVDSRVNAIIYSWTNSFAGETNHPALQEKFAK